MIDGCKVEEKLITFGELLKIKREKMGLTQKQANNSIKITGIAAYERGDSKPGTKILRKILDFYKISPQELASCKGKIAEKVIPVVAQDKPVKSLMMEVERLLLKVMDISDMGGIGNSVKKSCIEHLESVEMSLREIMILDRLI